MKRFQTALKNQLTKQDEKVTLELRELVCQLSLYTVQSLYNTIFTGLDKQNF